MTTAPEVHPGSLPRESPDKTETQYKRPIGEEVSIFRTKNLDQMLADGRKPGGLKKVLGPFDLIMRHIRFSSCSERLQCPTSCIYGSSLPTSNNLLIPVT